MSKNKKMFIGSSIIAVAIIFILVAATPGSAGVEVGIKEVLNDQGKYSEKFVTTEGLLIADSIEWDSKKLELKFTVRDEADGSKLNVIYNGVKPDNFTDDIICILEGAPSTTEEGLFVAESVKTKCPSKYEGQEDGYDAEMHENMNGGTYDPETHTIKSSDEGTEATK